MSEPRDSTITLQPRRTLSAAVCLLAVNCALLVGSGESFGDAIRVRSTAIVATDKVHLSDVAELTGDDVEALAKTVVGTLDPDTERFVVTQAAIREALSKAGVNWARVTLVGFEKVEITVKREDKAGPVRKQPADGGESKAAVSALPPVLLSNPTDEVTADAQLSLGDRLVAWMEHLAGAPRADLRVQYADRDAPLLRTIVLSDRLVFQTSSSTGLGRVPVTISRYRGDKLISTDRLTVDISRRCLAVVAVRSLDRGAVVTENDLAVREVFVTRDASDLLRSVDAAVGQSVPSGVKEGAILTTADVQPPFLVRRNDVVAVQVISGGVVVEMRTRALEDAAAGALLKVRSEYSREVMSVRVIAAGKAVLVTEQAIATKAVVK